MVAELQEIFSCAFLTGERMGQQHVLKAGQDVVIGRARETDFPINDELASRRHLKLSVRDAHIFLEDLASSNGTFVNGVRVTSATLRHGDRILVGNTLMRILCANSENTSPSKIALSPFMVGSLTECSVVDLLMMHSTTQRTGALTLHAPTPIRLYIDAGKLVAIYLNGKTPSDAMQELCNILEQNLMCDFSFYLLDKMPLIQKMFHEPTEATLLEASRRNDERNEELLNKSRNKDLALLSPLRAPLHALNKEELDILQMVLNQKNWKKVLDNSVRPMHDLEQTLKALIRKGYIQPVS